MSIFCDQTTPLNSGRLQIIAAPPEGLNKINSALVCSYVAIIRVACEQPHEGNDHDHFISKVWLLLSHGGLATCEVTGKRK